MKRTKFVNEVINLTSESIFVYDDGTGDIIEFGSVKVSDVLSVIGEDFNCCFVVDEMSVLLELLRAGVKIDSVATIFEKSLGRDNKIISKIKWAKDPDIIIRFRKENTF